MKPKVLEMAKNPDSIKYSKSEKISLFEKLAQSILRWRCPWKQNIHQYTSEYYHNESYDERLKNAIKMINSNKAWLNVEAERLNSLLELKKKKRLPEFLEGDTKSKTYTAPQK